MKLVLKLSSSNPTQLFAGLEQGLVEAPGHLETCLIPRLRLQLQHLDLQLPCVAVVVKAPAMLAFHRQYLLLEQSLACFTMAAPD